MCTGIETALVVATAVGSAAAEYSAGRASAQAAQFEAQQYRDQAELAKIEASNAAVQRMEEANRVRRANIARAAAAGILPTRSASFMNIQKTDDLLADRDLRLIRLGGRSRVAQLTGQGNQSASAGRSAFRTGVIRAGGSLISGYQDYRNLKEGEG